MEKEAKSFKAVNKQIDSLRERDKNMRFFRMNNSLINIDDIKEFHPSIRDHKTTPYTIEVHRFSQENNIMLFKTKDERDRMINIITHHLSNITLDVDYRLD